MPARNSLKRSYNPILWLQLNISLWRDHHWWIQSASFLPIYMILMGRAFSVSLDEKKTALLKPKYSTSPFYQDLQPARETCDLIISVIHSSNYISYLYAGMQYLFLLMHSKLPHLQLKTMYMIVSQLPWFSVWILGCWVLCLRTHKVGTQASANAVTWSEVLDDLCSYRMFKVFWWTTENYYSSLSVT